MLMDEIKNKVEEIGLLSEEIVDAIDSWVWYNGLGQGVLDLIEVVKLRNHDSNDTDGWNAYFNAWDLWYNEWCPDLQPLYMICVVIYGDYGTSPRSGWIDRKNISKCVEFLKMCCSTYVEDVEEKAAYYEEERMKKNVDL